MPVKQITIVAFAFIARDSKSQKVIHRIDGVQVNLENDPAAGLVGEALLFPRCGWAFGPAAVCLSAAPVRICVWRSFLHCCG